MTGSGAVDLFLRRWYIYLAAVLACVAVVVAVPSQPRMSAVRAELTLSPPPEFSAETPYVFSLETMLAFTVAVDEAYNTRYPSIELSSPTATLFGNKVPEGVSVAASTAGTQWQAGQNRPAIVVMTSAPTEEKALAALHTAISRVEEVTTQVQDTAEVPEDQRIRMLWEDRTFSVGSISPSRSATMKGTAVLAAVALVLATVVASGWDRLSERAARRRAEQSGRGTDRGTDPADPPPARELAAAGPVRSGGPT